jgi:hypothetical protein
MKRIIIEVNCEEEDEKIMKHINEFVKLNFQDCKIAVVRVEEI